MAKKGKNVMTIRTMNDMVALVNNNSQVLEKAINKLKRSNRNLRLFSFFSIGCAICAVMENRKRDEELYKLSVRVQRLENNEGD